MDVIEAQTPSVALREQALDSLQDIFY